MKPETIELLQQLAELSETEASVQETSSFSVTKEATKTFRLIHYSKEQTFDENMKKNLKRHDSEEGLQEEIQNKIFKLKA